MGSKIYKADILKTDINEQFASDNYSGISPEVLEYMIKANTGTVPAYGNDIYTKKASDKIREVFECDCEVFFVFNGTSANSLSLAAMSQSYHSVICHEVAHIETDECGAPAYASNGAKLLLGRSENGKLIPVNIEELVSVQWSHDIKNLSIVEV